MGKKTNDKRKEFFAELAARDKLRPPRVKKPPKVKVAPPVEPEFPECCMNRHANLPTLFIPCRDCPQLRVSVAGAGNRQKLSNPPQESLDKRA